jgi:hypothetical protein
MRKRKKIPMDILGGKSSLSFIETSKMKLSQM